MKIKNFKLRIRYVASEIGRKTKGSRVLKGSCHWHESEQLWINRTGVGFSDLASEDTSCRLIKNNDA